MATRLYIDSGGFLTADRTMTLAFGRAYGGSTVVYTGTSLTIPSATVREVGGARPRPTTTCSRGRATYLEENNVHLLDDERHQRQQPPVRRRVRPPRVSGRAVPDQPEGVPRSPACATSAARTPPRRARTACSCPRPSGRGVEVVTNCHVERIDERAVVGHRRPTATSASRRRGSRASTGSGRRRLVSPPAPSARRRCCCARRCRRAAGARPLLHLPPGADPGRRSTSGRSPTSSGHPKSYYCDHFAESDGFLLETCMYFPFTTAKNLDRIRRGARRADARDGPPADDPGARARPAAGGEPRHGRRRRRAGRALPLHRRRAALAGAGDAGVGADLLRGRGARVHAPAADRFFIDAADARRVDELIAARAPHARQACRSPAPT